VSHAESTRFTFLLVGADGAARASSVRARASAPREGGWRQASRRL